ncbi:MAG: hypothetical protein P4N60_05165 [Verrucomicrobiae bacterium]|nr:hypothetical protein [Verrucomicrobiae bacterium]
MKLTRAFIAAAPILISHTLAHALPASGPTPAIEQLQNSQQQQLMVPVPGLRAGTNAPELYAGENADIGPQRILEVGPKAGNTPHRNWVEGQLDTQIFYTDNASYGPQPRISSWVFVNTVLAAIAPDPFELGNGKLAPAIGFSSQWYNYNDGRMSPFDFDAQTAFANLRYLTGKWQFNLGANFTALKSQNNSQGHGTYSDTYREWLPNAGVQRAFSINDNMAFIVGDAVSYHFTWVPSYTLVADDVNDHLDNTLYLTFNWQATAHLVLQPFYRFQYSYYRNRYYEPGTIRNDYLNSLGLNVMYNFNKYVGLRAFYSYTTKYSDDPLTSTYDEMNGGLGASLDIRF